MNNGIQWNLHSRVGKIRLALVAALLGPMAALGQDIDIKTINLWREPVYSYCRHRPAAPQYLVIRSWKEWVDYCNSSSDPASAAALKSKPEGPKGPLGKSGQSIIDFDHYTLLVADEGEQGNSEPFLVFTSARERVREIFVDVLEVTAGHNCVSLATVNPDLHAYALIPRTDKTIHFLFSKAVRDCSSIRRVN